MADMLVVKKGKRSKHQNPTISSMRKYKTLTFAQEARLLFIINDDFEYPNWVTSKSNPEQFVVAWLHYEMPYSKIEKVLSNMAINKLPDASLTSALSRVYIRFDNADQLRDEVLTLMKHERKREGFFGGPDQVQPSYIKFLYAMTRNPTEGALYDMRHKFDKMNRLQEAFRSSGLYEYAFTHAHAFVKQHFPLKEQMFLNLYADRLPNQSLINLYYASDDEETGAREHIDRVCFCSVIVCLTNDIEGCLQVKLHGEYQRVPMAVGEAVIFTRERHMVEMSCRTVCRITAALFY